MSKRRIMGLFNDFDAAHAAIAEMLDADLKGFSRDCITLKSPIEHPEVEQVLGDRPIKVQRFTFFGALFGGITAFTLIAAAQATFLMQPKGGKPIVPIPPDLVLTYEMFILGGVLMTVLGFLICAGLPAKRTSLYHVKVSEDQIGVMLEIDERLIQPIKDLLRKHNVHEIMEEVRK
jgi:hypothetical protein